DVVARLIGQHMSDTWKQPVVIENRAGANGMIARLCQSDAVREELARKAAASRITGSAMGYEKQGQGRSQT
ncbi:MAG: hypothetical protein SGJ20_10020, partial [Planctomycetota bacterium]|nr:hypothetical protein [Planctomycetota bacterium]